MERSDVLDSFKHGAKLEFHAGWSGWTRPPTMAGGRGSPRVLNALRLDRLGELGNSTP